MGKQKISIADKELGALAMEAYVVNQLAIHKPCGNPKKIKHYTITHIPTGCSVQTHVTGFKRVKGLLESIDYSQVDLSCGSFGYSTSLTQTAREFLRDNVYKPTIHWKG
jgi:hypothetical protein